VVTLAWVFIGLDGWAFFNNPDNLRKLYKSLTLQPVDPASAPFFDLVFPLGWTLAFEMYFYIVFGVAMLAGRLRWFALASWMLLTLILLPAMQGGPTLNVRANLPFSWSYMQLMTNPIIYEFLAGVVIGLLYQSDRFKFSSASVARQVALVAVGLAAWYAYAGIGNFHGISRWGWPLALMVGALALASKTVQLPVPSWLAWIGTISYSMYLTHFLCQTMLTGLMTRRGIDTHTWGQVFITVLLAIPLASLSHYLLEQRLGEAVRARLVQLVDWLLPAASRQSEKVVKIAEIAKLPKRPRRPG
jgi:peptidoglycan/LPS O-acetylase OafA/YrhL